MAHTRILHVIFYDSFIPLLLSIILRREIYNYINGHQMFITR